MSEVNVCSVAIKLPLYMNELYHYNIDAIISENNSAGGEQQVSNTAHLPRSDVGAPHLDTWRCGGTREMFGVSGVRSFRARIGPHPVAGVTGESSSSSSPSLQTSFQTRCRLGSGFEPGVDLSSGSEPGVDRLV